MPLKELVEVPLFPPIQSVVDPDAIVPVCVLVPTETPFLYKVSVFVVLLYVQPTRYQVLAVRAVVLSVTVAPLDVVATSLPELLTYSENAEFAVLAMYELAVMVPGLIHVAKENPAVVLKEETVTCPSEPPVWTMALFISPEVVHATPRAKRAVTTSADQANIVGGAPCVLVELVVIL